jgi:hypothetical protein
VPLQLSCCSCKHGQSPDVAPHTRIVKVVQQVLSRDSTDTKTGCKPDNHASMPSKARNAERLQEPRQLPATGVTALMSRAGGLLR